MLPSFWEMIIKIWHWWMPSMLSYTKIRGFVYDISLYNDEEPLDLWLCFGKKICFHSIRWLQLLNTSTLIGTLRITCPGIYPQLNFYYIHLGFPNDPSYSKFDSIWHILCKLLKTRNLTHFDQCSTNVETS